MTDQEQNGTPNPTHEAKDGSGLGLSLPARIGGVAVFLVWAFLFAVGLMVASLPYRMQISPLASASDVAATIQGVFTDAQSVEGTAEELTSLNAIPSDSAGPVESAIDEEQDLEEPASLIAEQELDRDAAVAALDSTLRETAASIRRSVEPADLWLPATWAAALLSYTPTNILLLAVLAGILGSLACRANLDWQREPEAASEGKAGAPAEGTASRCDTINPCFSGLVRGLFVYLMLISGLLILTEDPFTNLNAARYVRLAGFTSLISFLVSLRGGLFARFLSGAAKRVGD